MFRYFLSIFIILVALSACQKQSQVSGWMIHQGWDENNDSATRDER